MTLIDILRDKLGLMQRKYACRIGDCWACTVLVDGKSMTSRSTLVATLYPGNHLMAKALLDENPYPTRDEVKKVLAGDQ